MTASDRTQAVLGAGHALNAMAGGFVFPFFAVYLDAQSHGRGKVWVGLVFASMTLLSAVGRMAGGELADQKSRRTVLVASVALRSVLLTVMGAAVVAAASPVFVCLVLVLSAVARGAYEPAADAMIADLIPPPLRPRAYARMRIARNAGWAIGPALGGFVGDGRFGALTLAAGALGFLNLLLSLRHLSETPHRPGVSRFHPRDLAEAFHHPLFRYHLILTAGIFLLFAQLLVSVSLDFGVRARLSSFELGVLYTMNGVLVVAAQAAVTRVASRFSAGRMLAVGAVVDGVGYLLVGSTGSFPLALLGIAIVTLGEMITLPLSAALAADIAPEDRRGRYLGVYGVFIDVGHGLGQLLGGLGLAAAGVDPLRFWYAVLLVSAAVAAGYLLFDRRLRASEKAIVAPGADGGR
jgi:MFS family permease